MTVSEFLTTLKKYVAPDSSDADYFDMVFSNCLEDDVAQEICEYSRTQKYYLISGKRGAEMFASRVINHYQQDMFAEWVLEVVLYENSTKLRKEFKAFGVRVSKEDYDVSIASAFREILLESASNNRSNVPHGNYKLRASLLSENPSGLCPCQDCGNHMKLCVGDEESHLLLQTLYLDENGSKNIDNAIGICNECFQAKDFDVQMLKDKKAGFARRSLANDQTEDVLFPERLRLAIQRLSSFGTDGLCELSYRSLKVAQKIPDDSIFLRNKIEGNVTKYFETLREALSDSDGESGYSYEELAKSIRSMFLKSSATGMSLSETFDFLSRKIADQINEDIIVGEIITSFFVQTCEVFNEISK